MRVLRSTIAALATTAFPACGDDPPHYIDAATGGGDRIDASSNLIDAAPIDAPLDAIIGDGGVAQPRAAPTAR